MFAEKETKIQSLEEKDAAAMRAEIRQYINYGDAKTTWERHLRKLELNTCDSNIAPGMRSDVFITKGKRPSQEDAYMVNDTKKNNPKEVGVFLKKSFMEIDRRSRAKCVNDGSTANVVYIATDNTVTVANLGDSCTMAAIRTIATGNIEIKPLSINHKPDNPAEMERIIALGGFVSPETEYSVARVSSLAMSRAFGDFHLKGATGKELISKIPDIQQIQLGQWVDKPQEYEVFLLTASDGLIGDWRELPIKPWSKPIEKQYSELGVLIAQYLGTGPSIDKKVNDLAAYLTCKAYSEGCADNITVITTKLNSNQIYDRIIGVFDGHGGSSTSNLAAATMKDIAKGKIAIMDDTWISSICSKNNALNNKQASDDTWIENMKIRMPAHKAAVSNNVDKLLRLRRHINSNNCTPFKL